MSHVVATYRYADGSAAERDALRPAHRQHLATLPVVLSGPTTSPDTEGAVIVVEDLSIEEVEAALDADPFVVAGLVAERTVVEWRVVMGSRADLLARAVRPS